MMASAIGAPAQQRVLRIRRERHAPAEAPRAYRHTLIAIDAQSGAVEATSDVAGRVTTSRLILRDAAQGPWTLAPNRAVLPTRWTLEDSAGRIAMQFDLELGRKLLHPLYRTALVLLDDTGRERLRLVDTMSSTAERVFGVSRSDWSLVRGEDAVATLTWLSPELERTRGAIGVWRRLLAAKERGVVSRGESHVLTAPAALAMLALFEELTE